MDPSSGEIGCEPVYLICSNITRNFDIEGYRWIARQNRGSRRCPWSREFFCKSPQIDRSMGRKSGCLWVCRCSLPRQIHMLACAKVGGPCGSRLFGLASRKSSSRRDHGHSSSQIGHLEWSSSRPSKMPLWSSRLGAIADKKDIKIARHVSRAAWLILTCQIEYRYGHTK